MQSRNVATPIDGIHGTLTTPNGLALIAAMINPAAMDGRDAGGETLGHSAEMEWFCDLQSCLPGPGTSSSKGAGFAEPQLSLTDLRDGVVQRGRGDSHQPGKGVVELQNQVDRSRNRQGADDEGSYHGWVPGCEKAEAGEDDG
jgi:hypothetical protein